MQARLVLYLLYYCSCPPSNSLIFVMKISFSSWSNWWFDQVKNVNRRISNKYYLVRYFHSYKQLLNTPVCYHIFFYHNALCRCSNVLIFMTSFSSYQANFLIVDLFTCWKKFIYPPIHSSKCLTKWIYFWNSEV